MITKCDELPKKVADNGIPEGYPVLTDMHPFLNKLTNFMSVCSHWLGTASDLLYVLNDSTTPPSTVTKLLKKYEWRLWERYRIEITFRRTNRKRIIELRKER